MRIIEFQSEKVGGTVCEFKVERIFCFLSSEGSGVESQVGELVFQ
jgi:hypothetical protein